MKKIFTVLAVAALCASCAKTDKCTCTVVLKSDKTTNKIEDAVLPRPEDGKCSDIKVSDYKGDHLQINFKDIADIKCKPLYE